MNKNSTQYTFLFAFIVCVTCSFLLALVSEGLRPKKELNEALDVKKNILKAVDLRDPLPAKATSEQILEAFDKYIEEIVIDEKGKVVEGKSAKDIEDGESLYPLYKYKEGSVTVAYCFPIVGKGLWSTLYGIFCLGT